MMPFCVVSDLTAPEHAALASLLGRPQCYANSLRIDVRQVDAAFRNSGIASSLRDALERLDGPIANLAWEELTKRWDLPRLQPLAKWGSWQKTYPQLPCGLKRGFSFFHHLPSEAWKPAIAETGLTIAGPGTTVARHSDCRAGRR